MTENQRYLNDCFKYNKETGELTWRFRPLHHFKSARDCNKFNKFSANLVAGTRSKTYITIISMGKSMPAHRIIWEMVYGECPDVIDHINGDKHDNRLVNLRNVDRAENMRNRKLNKRNKSGINGVSTRKDGKWLVVIRTKYIGLFDNFFEACCARKSAEYKAGFHENHGRR